MSRVDPTQCGESKQRAGGSAIDRSESCPVDELDIVDANGGLGCENALRCGNQFGGVALARGELGFGVADGAAERECLRALLGAEIDIAGS